MSFWICLFAFPALGLQQPAIFCGRTDVVLDNLVHSGRLPKEARCSPALRNIPICLSLQPGANAEATLGKLLDAEWTTKSGIRTLARTPKVLRRIQADQHKLLAAEFGKSVESWRDWLHRAEQDTAAFGQRIQGQIDASKRGAPTAQSPVDLPIDLVLKGCCVDVGSVRLARLKLGEYLYYSDVRDGVHLPFASEGLKAWNAYRRSLEEPTVREAMRMAQGVLWNTPKDSLDLTGVRVIVWIVRYPQGIRSSAWVFSPKGVLLDQQYRADLFAAPPDPAPIEIPNGARVEPSELSLVLARKAAGQKAADPDHRFKELLLAGRSRSLLDPYAEDVTRALALAFPKTTIAMQLDEGWFGQWTPALATTSPPLGSVLAAGNTGCGLRTERTGSSLYVRPALRVDSEEMLSNPEPLQQDMQATFSRSGESLQALCDLANGSSWSSFQFGLTGGYRVYAEDEGGQPGGGLEYYLLRLIGRLLPVPPSAGQRRGVAGTPVADASWVRLAIASPFMQPGAECPDAPAISQRSSIYRDTQVSMMPWEIQCVPRTYFALASGDRQRGPPWTRKDMTALLTNYFEFSLRAEGRKMEDVMVLRGESTVYDIRVTVGEKVAWYATVAPTVHWAAKAVRVADTPEGPAMIRDAMKDVKPEQVKRPPPRPSKKASARSGR